MTTLTKTGRAMLAIRDRYLSAEIMGVNLFKYRLLEREADSPGAPLLGQFLRVDETIVAWLLRHYQPQDEREPSAGCDASRVDSGAIGRSSSDVSATESSP